MFLDRDSPGVARDLFQVTCSGQGFEIDIGYTLDLHVIQRQPAFKMNRPGGVIEIRPAEIAGIPIQPDTQFRPAFGGGELEVHVVTVDGRFKEFGGLLRP